MANSAGASPTVLFIGYAGIPNGFARVIRSLLESLGHILPQYEFHQLAINLALTEPMEQRGWTVHGNSGTLHNAETLVALLQQVQPAIVVIVDVPWVCAERVDAIEASSSARIVCYCAIDDSQSLPPAVLQKLARAHCLVAFTRFARGLLLQGFCDAGIERPPRVEVIPHGVDTSVFHPIVSAANLQESRRLSRLSARRQLFGNDERARDFVVLNANRNQPFKRIDIALEGFALFAKDKPDSVILYLHMASRTPAPGEVPLVDRLNIRQRILTTTREELHPHVNDAVLNTIYNACDVGMNTSEKEGWGLIAFEHGATGAPQLVPDHGACAELWRGSALLLDAATESSSTLNRRAVLTVTPEAVAHALEILYQDEQEREHWGEAAFSNANRPEYRWDAIAARWDRLFSSLLAGAAWSENNPTQT
jgi:glycosyltransferase involved in cell wall biosynthesis